MTSPDDELENVPEVLAFLLILTAVIVGLAVFGCSADVNVHGVPGRIELAPVGCAADAGTE